MSKNFEFEYGPHAPPPNLRRRRDRWITKVLTGLGIGLLATVFALILVFFTCGPGLLVDKDDAIHAAEQQGYIHVRITGTSRFWPSLSGCGHDDAAGFEMSAVNARGMPVKITTCCGWSLIASKGCTVRSR